MQVIKIDRQKLAKYIKDHADVLAERAGIDVDLTKLETMGGDPEFLPIATIELSDIPLKEIEKE